VYDDDSGSPGDTVAEYQYDGLSHRIAKLLPSGNNWNRNDYYYNENRQVVEERYGAEQAKETVPTAAWVQYVWDVLNTSVPVLRWRDADGQSGNGLEECLYYCCDASMSVTALVDASSGNVVERYQYDPYGEVTIFDENGTEITWDNSKEIEITWDGDLPPTVVPP